ncbi:uncharacterized protein L969DRAFT_16728 [Mixia osmundae IAM 14324]|uniref:Protein YIP n=1 Tax=Mixia osmundae (strain CBS 9802 / IAM 14324 / JCM 22182 / KY 12970) TaxID=764103 RepID=G7E9V3_MIXOS|nr:uncharacterized protein L969DRAFT_16728 [Mixia osmundae IAM 14324]KEI40054.1 hypothetical protein L969DRAFT_16728 [Mixia osmundae IAM 14324]GAA99422.1 hypothetical protein E5Q_06120 [Mixia osmundae IAM 14324]
MSSGYQVPPQAHHAVEIEADEDEDDLVAYGSSGNAQSKGKAKDSSSANAPLLSTQSSGAADQLSGSIGKPQAGASASSRSSPAGHRQTIGGIQVESRFGGVSTLDEPVSETILRDAKAISDKMVQVLRPTRTTAVLREWDLWGPLIFCLALAVMLSVNAPESQSLSVFTGVFVIVWLGSVVVTLNAKLLGGKVSFFQSLCVLGYCIFPLVISAFVTLFVRLLWVRIPVCLAGFAWAVFAAVNFLGGTRLEDSRAVLAVYPCFLLFSVLAWIIMLS